MSWDVSTTTHPTARRDYLCGASEWVINAGLNEQDFDPEDWITIQKAEKEGWKILKGTKYRHVRGLFEGEWCTYRARIDLDDICQKYVLYEY